MYRYSGTTGSGTLLRNLIPGTFILNLFCSKKNFWVRKLLTRKQVTTDTDPRADTGESSHTKQQ